MCCLSCLCCSYKAHTTVFISPGYSKMLLRGLRGAPGLPSPATETRRLPPGFRAAAAARCRPELSAAGKELQEQRAGQSSGRAGERRLFLHTVGARARQTNSIANFWALERTWKESLGQCGHGSAGQPTVWFF